MLRSVRLGGRQSLALESLLRERHSLVLCRVLDRCHRLRRRMLVT